MSRKNPANTRGRPAAHAGTDVDPIEGAIIRFEIANAPRPLVRFVHEFWECIETVPYTHNWHIDAKCDHLQAVARNEIRDLVISEPPGFMKSVTTNILFDAFVWGAMGLGGGVHSGPTQIDGSGAGKKFFHGGYDLTLVLRDSDRLIQLLQHQKFRAVYPEFSLGHNNSLALGQFTNGHGGWRTSSTPEGRGIGWHYHYLMIVDPIKPSAILAGVCDPKILIKAEQWIRTTLSGRHADIKDFHKVLTMQRLHDRDPAGVFLEEGWEHLCIPMHYVPACSWDIGSSLGGAIAYDPRTEPGEPAWPARYSAEDVAAKEKNMLPADISAQHQQNPSPAEGNIIKAEFFVHRPSAALPSFENKLVIQCWDFGFKGTDKSHSRVCGSLWCSDGADFDLCDLVLETVDYSKSKRLFRDAQKRPGWSRGRVQYVEAKANGLAIESDLKTSFPGIVLWDPGKDDKTVRMLPHLDIWIDHRVSVPPVDVYWVPEYLKEITRYPKYGKDDQWDITSMGLTILRGNKAQYFAALKAAGKHLKNFARILEGG